MEPDWNHVTVLIKQFRGGDNAAAEELIELLRDWVFAMAKRQVGFAEAEAEELAADVEEVIWENLLPSGPVGQKEVRSWILHTIRNKSNKRYRDKNRRKQVEERYTKSRERMDVSSGRTRAEEGLRIKRQREISEHLRMKKRISQVIEASRFFGSREIRDCVQKALEQTICQGTVDKSFVVEISTKVSRTKLEVMTCLKFLASQVVNTKPNRQSDLAKYRKRVLKLLGGQTLRNDVFADLHMVTLTWPGWPACSLKTILKPQYAKYLDELRSHLKAHGLFTTVGQLRDILRPLESDDRLQAFREAWDHWM